MEIHLQEQLYSIAYQASLILVFAIYLYEGYKRKFDWIQWLLLLLTTRVLMVVGSKIAGLHTADLVFLSDNFYLPPISDKNMVGALFFGLLAIPLAKKILNIKYPVLDAFAIAIPLGMAVQRIGCLFGGCCYGSETTMPWAIHYHSEDFVSAALHPVPLYYAISSLVIVAIVAYSSKLWKRSASLAFFSLSLIFLSRFIVDFYRNPESQSELLRQQWFGLFLSQWFSLLAVIVFVFILISREKNWLIFSTPIDRSTNPNIHKPIFEAAYLCVFILLIYILRNWLQIVELWMIILILVPSIVLILRTVFANYFKIYVRISTLALLSFAVLISSQTFHKEPGKYQFINIGAGTGQLQKITLCGGVVSEADFYGLSGGYSQLIQGQYSAFEYGANLMLANYRALNQVYDYYYDAYGYSNYTYNTISNSQTIFEFFPYVRMDYKWLGAGIGGRFGNFVKVTDDFSKLNTVLPYVSVRLFPEKYFYLKYSYGESFSYISSLGVSVFELGSGFGLNNGFKIGLNLYAVHDFEAGLFGLNTRIPIDDKLKLLMNFQTVPGETGIWTMNAGLKLEIPAKAKTVNEQELLLESKPLRDSTKITVKDIYEDIISE